MTLTYLEKDVLHNVGTIGALELKGLSLEVDIIKSPVNNCYLRSHHNALAIPDLCGEGGRVTHLSLNGHEGKTLNTLLDGEQKVTRTTYHCTSGSITSSP